MLALISLAQNSGTTVIATKYEANSDSTTARASAVNRNRLTPYRKTTGKNTMAVVSVAASTGKRNLLATFLCGNVWRFAHFHVAEDVLQHHHRVVDQTRERQRQPAQDHRVDRAAAEVIAR